MFMLWLYRYITGYVKFKAVGGFSERFLNLCAARGITIWGSYREDEVLYGYMMVRDYKTIRKIARKSKVRLKVQKKHGLVFIIHRYRRRKGLAVGILMFFFVLWFLSSFIWNINIVGNENIKTEVIISKLKSAGVYEGRWRKSINADNTRQHLLMNSPELSWAAINIRGTLATVDVRETVKPPNKTTNDLPCNIIAATDGRILSIKCYEGTTQVKVGSAVVKGDLLISGAIELKNGMTVFKHARADVWAETTHELSCFIPFEQKQQILDDDAQTRRVITLFSINIPTYLGSVSPPYEVKKSVWRPEIGGVGLPLSITTASFYRKTEQKYKVSADVAEKMAKTEIDEMCEKQLSKILIKKLGQTAEIKLDGVLIKQKFLCKENISKDENILINQ